MVTKISSYWSRFDGSLTESIPSLAEIQRFKDTGFNAVMIAEISYNDQMQNIDDCINSRKGWTPTSNPITTTINNIKNNGMEAHFILNPDRYGGVVGILDRPLDKSKFLEALSYISGLGVSWIEFEEFELWWDFVWNPISKIWDAVPNVTHMERTTEFMQECRDIIPSNIKFGCNLSSQVYKTIQALGINPPDAAAIMDFIKPQPGKGPSPDYLITNEIIQNAVNKYTTYFPNTMIHPCVYKKYSCGGVSCTNANLVQNIQYCIANGINFTLWPSSQLINNDYILLRPVLTGDNGCPTPYHNYTITQE